MFSWNRTKLCLILLLQYQSVFLLTLVTLRTTRFNTKTYLHFVRTGFIVFHMILTINMDWLLGKYYPVGRCKGQKV